MGQGEDGHLALAPVIVSFMPSRTQISPKESVTLNWTIKGDGVATLECGGEKKEVPFTGSTVITPDKSGCCTLTAGNKDGSDQETVCITVQSIKEKEEPPRINSFTASSTQVYAGDRVVLNWSISGDGEAYLTCGGERKQVPFSGSTAIAPSQSGCCTLVAGNKAGSDQKSACIKVMPPKITPPKDTPPKTAAPVINNFSSSCKESPGVMACTLNWSVTGPSGTTVSISGLGSVGLSGSRQVNYGGSYTITVTNAGGSATRTVQVK
jgi:hypothetical protein